MKYYFCDELKEEHLKQNKMFFHSLNFVLRNKCSEITIQGLELKILQSKVQLVFKFLFSLNKNLILLYSSLSYNADMIISKNLFRRNK